MKLNIYEKRKIVKTYEASTYDLLFGTLEDVADAIKLDELKTGSNEELLKMAANLVLSSMDTIKNLLKDVFEGLTDDEIKCTRVNEIATVLVEIVIYTIQQLGVGNSSKN